MGPTPVLLTQQPQGGGNRRFLHRNPNPGHLPQGPDFSPRWEVEPLIPATGFPVRHWGWGWIRGSGGVSRGVSPPPTPDLALQCAAFCGSPVPARRGPRCLLAWLSSRPPCASCCHTGHLSVLGSQAGFCLWFPPTRLFTCQLPALAPLRGCSLLQGALLGWVPLPLGGSAWCPGAPAESQAGAWGLPP